MVDIMHFSDFNAWQINYSYSVDLYELHFLTEDVIFLEISDSFVE